LKIQLAVTKICLFNTPKVPHGSATSLVKSKRFVSIVGIVLLVVLVAAALSTMWQSVPSSTISQSEGEQLYQQAKALESQGNFTQAIELYFQALPMLQAQNSSLTQHCREGA